MATYLGGLDLGQVNDYSGLSIIEQAGSDAHNADFNVRHLKRYGLGTDYVDVVNDVAGIMKSPELRGSVLVVDGTGCGVPIVNMLRRCGLTMVAICITGGNSVNRESNGFVGVPKRDLIGAGRLAIETHHLHFADALPDVAILINELLTFRRTVTLATGHDSYAAWRESAHDDMVLSLCMPLWYATWRNVWTRGPAAGQ